MPDFKYVVVGSGMTGHAAAQGIRSVDASGSIALLGERQCLRIAKTDARQRARTLQGDAHDRSDP